MNWSRTISCDELGPAIAQEYQPFLWRLPGELYRALTRHDPITHRYVLLVRFVLANVLGLALASSLRLGSRAGSCRMEWGVA